MAAAPIGQTPVRTFINNFIIEPVIAIAAEWLVNFAVGVPRTYLGEGPPRKSYEEKSKELLEKLPVTRALRAKLKPDELKELEARERKYFEVLFDRERYAKPTVASLDGTFFNDYEPPYAPELDPEIKRLPYPNKPIQIPFLPGVEPDLPTDHPINLLSRFRLPESLYSGPMYSGGRFYEEGERLNLKDFAAIPLSDLDLYARDHDIRVSLASSAPTLEKRKELLEAADSIFHHQIYLSDELPLYHGELGVNGRENIRGAINAVRFVLGAYGSYKDAQASIERDINAQLRQFEQAAQQNTGHFNRQLAQSFQFHTIHPHEAVRVENYRDRPIDQMYHTVEVPPADAFFEIVNDRVVPLPAAVYDGSLNLYQRQPLFQIYATNPNNIVFNNPHVRQRLELEVIAPLIREQERLLAQGQSFMVGHDNYNRYLDDLTRDITTIIAAQDHQAHITGDRMNPVEQFPYLAQQYPHAVQQTLTTLDEETFRRVAEHERVVESSLPSINAIRASELEHQNINSIARGIARSFIITTASHFLFGKHLNDFIKGKPELATDIKTALPDYQRGNPLVRWAAEIVFRKIGSNVTNYQPLTQEEIKEYLDAIELKAENDPFYQLLETPKPKTPVKPAPISDKVDRVADVAKVGSYKQLKDLFSHQTPQEREETKLAIEKKLIDYDVEELYDFLF